MPREAPRVDFSVHSFTGSSAAPAETTSVSVVSLAPVYSTMLITVAELCVSVTMQRNDWWLGSARGFLNFHTHWGLSVCSCPEGISARLRFLDTASLLKKGSPLGKKEKNLKISSELKSNLWEKSCLQRQRQSRGESILNFFCCC